MDELNPKSNIVQEPSEILDISKPKKEDITETPVESDKSKKNPYYTYFLAFVVFSLVLILLYYTYNSFQKNMNAVDAEPFVITQPRTDTQADKSFDKSFDVDKEVNKLTIMQKKYLSSINK
jgi:hypothetical protein